VARNLLASEHILYLHVLLVFSNCKIDWKFSCCYTSEISEHESAGYNRGFLKSWTLITNETEYVGSVQVTVISVLNIYRRLLSWRLT